MRAADSVVMNSPPRLDCVYTEQICFCFVDRVAVVLRFMTAQRCTPRLSVATFQVRPSFPTFLVPGENAVALAEGLGLGCGISRSRTCQACARIRILMAHFVGCFGCRY